MKCLSNIFFFVTFFCLMSDSSFAQTNADFEQRLATIMKRSDDQQRRSLNYNSILARVARQRAYDMARRDYFGHVNPDGIGPNYLVTQAGYTLPDFYAKEKSGNSIESIAAGDETPEEAWKTWMNSTGHRTHLVGLSKFYAEQTDYGIGYAFIAGSEYEHYWVVITAKPGKDNLSSISNESSLETESQNEAGNQLTADDLYNRANEEFSEGNYREANNSITKAIKLNSSLSKYYYFRGIVRFKGLEDYAGAIDDLNKAVKLNPKNADSYNARGSVRLLLKEYSNALSDFNQAISLDPDDENFYNSRGAAKLGLGNTTGACEDFRRACRAKVNSACENLSGYCNK